MKKHWNQRSAALHAGVSPVTYSRAENGTPIQEVKAQKIIDVFIDAFGIKQEDLLFEEASPNHHGKRR